MNWAIQQQLLSLEDKKYKDFQCNLCPGVTNIIGVRLPILRKLAKELITEDWRPLISYENNQYYEEYMLLGIIIGSVKVDLNERLALIKDFVPHIDNWAVCDSFCSNLKFTINYRKEVFALLSQYITSKKEFELRFAIVMLLDYYLVVPEYLDQTLDILEHIKHEGYYVKMAVAWAVSIAYIKFPVQTMVFLQNTKLDNFTYNKALQKITESLRIDPQSKNLIRSMKR